MSGCKKRGSDLVQAFFRLEFYRNQKGWKFCSEVQRQKELDREKLEEEVPVKCLLTKEKEEPEREDSIEIEVDREGQRILTTHSEHKKKRSNHVKSLESVEQEQGETVKEEDIEEVPLNGTYKLEDGVPSPGASYHDSMFNTAFIDSNEELQCLSDPYISPPPNSPNYPLEWPRFELDYNRNIVESDIDKVSPHEPSLAPYTSDNSVCGAEARGGHMWAALDRRAQAWPDNPEPEEQFQLRCVSDLEAQRGEVLSWRDAGLQSWSPADPAVTLFTQTKTQAWGKDLECQPMEAEPLECMEEVLGDEQRACGGSVGCECVGCVEGSEFMRGAHVAPHSTEDEISLSDSDEPELGEVSLGWWSRARLEAVCQRARRRLRAVTNELSARDRMREHQCICSGVEERPTRDAGDIVSGSHRHHNTQQYLYDLHRDQDIENNLWATPNLQPGVGRGRGRLAGGGCDVTRVAGGCDVTRGRGQLRTPHYFIKPPPPAPIQPYI